MGLLGQMGLLNFTSNLNRQKSLKRPIFQVTLFSRSRRITAYPSNICFSLIPVLVFCIPGINLLIETFEIKKSCKIQGFARRLKVES